MAAAYTVVTIALSFFPARVSRMVSQPIQIPADAAPSKKRTKAAVSKEWVTKGNTETVTA